MNHSAFANFECIASGTLAEVYAAAGQTSDCQIFDHETGRVVDVDPRFPPKDEGPRPGRPKLGVATQPGGASVALRKLVEAASRDPKSRQRQRRDAAYRLATALVGNAPGYEEAMRALYAGASEDFAAHIEAWPADVRRVLEEMTEAAF
jgi:hypothetical protein